MVAGAGVEPSDLEGMGLASCHCSTPHESDAVWLTLVGVERRSDVVAGVGIEPTWSARMRSVRSPMIAIQQKVVDLTGLEPITSSVQARRSSNMS